MNGRNFKGQESIQVFHTRPAFQQGKQKGFVTKSPGTRRQETGGSSGGDAEIADRKERRMGSGRRGQRREFLSSRGEVGLQANDHLILGDRVSGSSGLEECVAEVEVRDEGIRGDADGVLILGNGALDAAGLEESVAEENMGHGVVRLDVDGLAVLVDGFFTRPASRRLMASLRWLSAESRFFFTRGIVATTAAANSRASASSQSLGERMVNGKWAAVVGERLADDDRMRGMIRELTALRQAQGRLSASSPTNAARDGWISA